MDETGLMEITTETSVFFGIIKRKIHLSKQKVCTTDAATCAGNTPKKTQNSPENAPISENADTITSPMVGVVYLSPEPTAKPFVKIGKTVAKGDTLCLVEAMKTFSPIKALKDGVVADILVGEGDTVEFGTPLIILK